LWVRLRPGDETGILSSASINPTSADWVQRVSPALLDQAGVYYTDGLEFDKNTGLLWRTLYDPYTQRTTLQTYDTNTHAAFSEVAGSSIATERFTSLTVCADGSVLVVRSPRAVAPYVKRFKNGAWGSPVTFCGNSAVSYMRWGWYSDNTGSYLIYFSDQTGSYPIYCNARLVKFGLDDSVIFDVLVASNVILPDEGNPLGPMIGVDDTTGDIVVVIPYAGAYSSPGTAPAFTKEESIVVQQGWADEFDPGNMPGGLAASVLVKDGVPWAVYQQQDIVWDGEPNADGYGLGSIVTDKLLAAQYMGGGIWGTPGVAFDFIENPPVFPEGYTLPAGAAQYAHILVPTVLNDSFGMTVDFVLNSDITCTVFFARFDVDSAPPVPVCPWLDLWVWRQLHQFSSLTEDFQFPPGYEKALLLQLAAELAIERFGKADPALLAEAAQAFEELGALNMANSQALEDLK
jgi:hypothetical protein